MKCAENVPERFSSLYFFTISPRTLRFVGRSQLAQVTEAQRGRDLFRPRSRGD